MIARLHGTVFELEEKALILDVAGVGYRVSVLPETKKKAEVGKQLTLRIHHHINDDSENLYGFDAADQLEYFLLLLTVPSVGVRTAMAILEAAPPAVLTQAVTQADTALLTKIGGVGKKTAERIIVELKGKFSKLAVSNTPTGKIQQETIEALVSIGYTASQARTAVGKLPAMTSSVEEAVRHILKSGGKG